MTFARELTRAPAIKGITRMIDFSLTETDQAIVDYNRAAALI